MSSLSMTFVTVLNTKAMLMSTELKKIMMMVVLGINMIIMVLFYSHIDGHIQELELVPIFYGNTK